MIWLGIVGGVLCLGVAAWLFFKTIKKHKKIDTRAWAYVDKIQELGFSGGKKIYAITYKVNANEPFKVLISPCYKAYSLGKKRMLYFEKGNAKANHYFVRWGMNFDRRFSPAIAFTVFGLTFIIQGIVRLFA